MGLGDQFQLRAESAETFELSVQRPKKIETGQIGSAIHWAVLNLGKERMVHEYPLISNP